MSKKKFVWAVQSFRPRGYKNQNFIEKTEKTCKKTDNQDLFSIIGGTREDKYRFSSHRSGMKQAGIRPLFFYIVFSPNRLPRICVFLYMLYMIITCIMLQCCKEHCGSARARSNVCSTVRARDARNSLWLWSYMSVKARSWPQVYTL